MTPAPDDRGRGRADSTAHAEDDVRAQGGFRAPALTSRALEELRSASPVAIDPAVRADYMRLLEQIPDAVLRDGPARSAEGGGLHLTASAVVLDATAEHLALVWHARGRCWVQPGGHLEAADASLEQAVRREVAEETGLSGLQRVGPGPALLEPHDLASTFGACGGHWDVVFVLRAEQRASALPMRAEAEGAPAPIWVPWPRDPSPSSAVRFSPAPQLPSDAAADMPEILGRLAPYLDEYAAGV
jgi:8-oxo-dGTP pyrophosphatase MutT (NUDIX family)